MSDFHLYSRGKIILYVLVIVADSSIKSRSEKVSPGGKKMYAYKGEKPGQVIHDDLIREAEEERLAKKALGQDNRRKRWWEKV